jgi:hypothetical protein
MKLIEGQNMLGRMRIRRGSEVGDDQEEEMRRKVSVHIL